MSNAQQPAVADWVARTRAGDRLAFEHLVRQFENAAYAAALSRLPVVEDAQDIVQDAFVEAYGKLHQLREPERFGWWLRRIVHHRALNWLRQHRGVAWSEQTTAQLDTRSQTADAQRVRHRELWEAVHGLPEKLREIVLMHYLDGGTYRDIAAVMGLSVATVNTRLNRARRQLRRELSPSHEEAWTMAKTDIAEEVRESIYQIAREEIHQTFSAADTGHVVLFCGVRSDVEICRTDGDQVVITGSKTAIGQSEEEGLQCLAATQIQVDRVDNYLRTGPHPGEVAVGANSESAQIPPEFELQLRPSHQWLDRLGQRSAPLSPVDERETGTGVYRTWASDELYSELSPRDAAIRQRIRRDLGRPVTRLSVVQPEAQDICLSPEEFSESIRRAFRPLSDICDYAFGANGFVDLVVALPAGVAITVLRADSVAVSQLRSDISIIDCYNVELSDIQGDVHLLNTTVERACDIEGAYAQSQNILSSCELLGGVNMEIRRSVVIETVLERISGRVDVDLLEAKLTATDLRGEVKIRNRCGDTRFRVPEGGADSGRYHLESDSGQLHVSIAPALVEHYPLTLHTLCGYLDANAVWEQLPHRSTNSGSQVISLKAWATPDQGSALLAHTRDGKIIIDKSP